MAGISIAQLTAKGTEHGEQVALFAWAAIAHIHGFETAWQWAEHGPAALLGLSMPSVRAVPELEWMHAIPNGGSRGDDERTKAIRGGNMKAEGARSGVADIFLPVPVRAKRKYDAVPIENKTYQFEIDEIAWCGLYIEMKKPSLRPKSAEAKGGLSDDQLTFKAYAHRMGYGWVVCYTWREAAEIVQQYLKG